MSYRKIDLHLHSTVSDGTDTPAELLSRIKAAGIELFSLTDHDATEGCDEIVSLLGEGDPAFIRGAEFSCEDEEGKYHILGYGYDASLPSVRELLATSRRLRAERLKCKLDHLEKKCGFRPTEGEMAMLLSLANPGRPHLAKLLIKHGYAPTMDQAFRSYFDDYRGEGEHIRPEQAIRAVREAHGIPVLAHPVHGGGNERIYGEALDRRVRRLTERGLRGIEAYYSAFAPDVREEVLRLADRYDLMVTAGSDYHGTHKTIPIGKTGLEGEIPDRFTAFLRETEIRNARAD